MSLLKRLNKHDNTSENQKETGMKKNENKQSVDPYYELKIKIQKKIIEDMDPKLLKDAEENDDKFKGEIQSFINETLEEHKQFIPHREKKLIIEEIVDEITGFGPINSLVLDPEVSEIMVNGPKQVYVEKNGKLQLTNVHFRDDNHVLHIIEKIVSPLGRRIDESSPMVDARLPDGSRVNAIIPPLALDGPVLTIRKFSRDPFTINDLISFKTLSPQMAKFLKACVETRLNIIVSGGTGSGKTTTLNVLSSFVPGDERIVTIEDAAELQLSQEHVVRLETRPPNLEGKGEIAIRDLVRNSLRMRPDRIIVGEVRGGEALDMLQAMNTGHDGSITTCHANSPRDALSRLETMVMMSGMELPPKAIREQIASAIDVILQQSRLKDGSRKVTHITEVQGMEGDVIILQDIFVFQQKGRDERGRIQGEFKPTGIIPKFVDKFKGMGIPISYDIFKTNNF